MIRLHRVWAPKWLPKLCRPMPMSSLTFCSALSVWAWKGEATPLWRGSLTTISGKWMWSGSGFVVPVDSRGSLHWGSTAFVPVLSSPCWGLSLCQRMLLVMTLIVFSMWCGCVGTWVCWVGLSLKLSGPAQRSFNQVFIFNQVFFEQFDLTLAPFQLFP